MQVSYKVRGESGAEAARALESRLRHDAHGADAATVQVLDGIASYVRESVSRASGPVDVEIDVTIRTKSQGAHLAPAAEVAEGNPAAPSADEGDETGVGEIGTVIRSLSLVTDHDVQESGREAAERVLQAMEDEALAAARAAEQESGSAGAAQ